jgi:hypothetical protein
MENSHRKRSPRAPTLALEDALEKAIQVYEKERLHQAPVDIVAQALGLKNASNGSAGSLIASLRYFGMLVRPNEGLLAVSKAVETYKYAPNQEMKTQIVLEFLKAPPLYKELLEKYSSGLPSSATLKYELIQKGFLPQAVDAVLSAFLQSVSFAKFYEARLDDQVDESPESAPPSEDAISSEAIDQKTIAQKISDAQRRLNPVSDGTLDQIPIRLSGGRKAWLAIPTPFYESDKARIKAQIEVLFADKDERD